MLFLIVFSQYTQQILFPKAANIEFASEIYLCNKNS